MKRNKMRNEINVDEVLRSFPSASHAQVESARERIFNNVWSNAAGRDDRLEAGMVDLDAPRRTGWWQFAAVATVAAVLIAAVWIGIFLQRDRAYAVLQTADSGLYRVLDGKTVFVRPGERIEAQQIVRSSGPAGAIIRLADGSLVEMRSESELSLERANDGLRIRLQKGDVIVNAAKQHKGHLYLQTKDVTVSVVGTVFLVNAEPEGSRVAVIEGEVRVQHGAAEQRLRRGEQVVTTPFIEPSLVKEEISWSRNAEAHLALLQQPGASIAAKDGTVTGIVLTTSGLPAAGFRVAAMRTDSATSFRAMLSLTETDSTGHYQLENVPPGRYYITVGRLDVLTYYPGTLDVTKASAVLITSVATVSGIDFVIQDPSAAPSPPPKLLFNPDTPTGIYYLPQDSIKKILPIIEVMKGGEQGAAQTQPSKDPEEPGARMLREILKGVRGEPPRGEKAPESPGQK